MLWDVKQPTENDNDKGIRDRLGGLAVTRPPLDGWIQGSPRATSRTNHTSHFKIDSATGGAWPYQASDFSIDSVTSTRLAISGQ